MRKNPSHRIVSCFIAVFINQCFSQDRSITGYNISPNNRIRKRIDSHIISAVNDILADKGIKINKIANHQYKEKSKYIRHRQDFRILAAAFFAHGFSFFNFLRRQF